MIDTASLISDVVLIDPLVGVDSVATVATKVTHTGSFATLGAGEENLRGYVDIGPGSVSGDLDTIGHG